MTDLPASAASPAEPSRRPGRLAGRVAVITGGGSGIGRAIAVRFAREGATVVVSGRRLEPLEQTVEQISHHGNPALAVSADVADPASHRQLVGQVVAAFGGIDVLVNNAGIARHGPLCDVDDNDVHALIDVDLKGPVFAIREALPHLVHSAQQDRRPCVLNISSNVTQMALQNYAVYSAAKAGLDMLTRCLALELASEGVRVNAILPGVIATPIFESMMTADNAREFLESFSASVPLGRVGQPDDIARIAVALCEPENDWVTGALVPVDGGLSLGPS